MPPTRLLVLVALALAGVTGCRGPASAPPAGTSPSPDLNAPLPSPVPEIVARVNGHAVTSRALVPLVRKHLARSKNIDIDRPAAVRRALTDYIDRELLFQEAVGRGLKADDGAVQYAYDRARVDHPDDANWAEYLGRLGFDPQTYKDEIRVQETINELLRTVAETLTVEESEVRALYDADPSAFPPPEGKAAGYETVREHVKAQLLERRRSHLLSDLVGALRARARIETYI